MKRTFWIKKLPVAMLGLILIVATAGFQANPSKTKQITRDTVPNRNGKIRDIDEALEELEKSKAEVSRSLKEIDFEKIEKEIREATKNIHIDADKMKANLDKALKEVDLAKIQADVQRSLKEVDAVGIKAEMDKAMKEIDFEKIKANIEASVAKIDWEKMNREIDKIKSVDLKKLEADLQNIKPGIEKSIKDAHEGIEKAKTELKAYKSFIDDLDRDGLINKKEDYTIAYRNGELTINGKKQAAGTTTKYQSFLKGRKDFTLKKESGGFSIDND